MCEGKCILLALPSKDFESLTGLNFKQFIVISLGVLSTMTLAIAGGFVWQSARKRAKPPARQATMTSPTTKALRIII